jgi:hypothetical protein
MSNNSFHIDSVSFAYPMSQHKAEYRKIQQHSHNRTLLVTIPITFADAISITKNSVVKMTLEDNKRIVVQRMAD